MYVCRYCESATPQREFAAREMMFGYRDAFTYVVCDRCGSLQIKETPPDLAKYYPTDYYSYTARRDHVLKRWLKKRRFEQARGRDSLTGRLLVRVWGEPPLASWLKPSGVGFDDAVLDVGSGGGELLLQMRDVGFTNLTGADPFVERDLTLPGDIRILKRRLREVDGPYDLVMFNHSLEHVPDPADELHAAAGLLERGKPVIVRLPVAGTHAWRTYGADWVQLDAPRHLSVPTETGLRALADRTGFEVETVQYESTGFQFWGSEQYRRDIPLRDPRSYRHDPKASPFSREEIRAFEEHAERLNREGDGDAACFVLRRR